MQLFVALTWSVPEETSKRNTQLQRGGRVTQAGSVRPGGRTARTRAAVFDAALEELADRGWDQVSVESIAARARVHKTTVYRRWGGKARLVAEALEAAAERRIQVPDRGNIDQELRALARAVLAILTSRDGAATVRALVAGAQGSPEVARVVRRFWATRLAQVGPIADRAVARGQLPQGTDPDDLMRHLAAPLFHRLLVTAEPLTQAAADQAAAAALAAARAGVFARSREGRQPVRGRRGTWST
jgi:AcrR family transcriptional regulator